MEARSVNPASASAQPPGSPSAQPAGSASAQPPASGPASATRLAFVAIVIAMLPAVLDQTILATALPTIAAGLGRLTDVSWVISVYVIAAAASTPLWGK